VAGHKGKDAMLKEANTILKPLSVSEFEFYENLRKMPSEVQARPTVPPAHLVIGHVLCLSAFSCRNSSLPILVAVA